MKWATRANCKVDRTACAWLIRRYIDPAAEFVFITDPAAIPVDATAFDIAGQSFSHHGDLVTFEVMAQHYGIDDEAVRRLGQIVHQADVEDERHDAPEAAGLDAIVRGLGALLNDDQRLLDETALIYDALLHRLTD